MVDYFRLRSEVDAVRQAINSREEWREKNGWVQLLLKEVIVRSTLDAPIICLEVIGCILFSGGEMKIIYY